MHRFLLLIFPRSGPVRRSCRDSLFPGKRAGLRRKTQPVTRRRAAAHRRSAGAFETSGRLANPEIEVELSRNLNAPEGAVGVGVSQQFPLTARLRLEKAVSRAQLAAAEAEVRDAERKLGAEAGTAMVKLLALGGSARCARSSSRTAANSRISCASACATARPPPSMPPRWNSKRKSSAPSCCNSRRTRGAARRIARAGRHARGRRDRDRRRTLGARRSLPGRASDPARRPDFTAAQHSAEAAETRRDAGPRATVGRHPHRPQRLARALRRCAGWFPKRHFCRSALQPAAAALGRPNAGRIEEADAAAKRAELETDALAFQIRAETAAARDTMAALAKVVSELDGALLPKGRANRKTTPRCLRGRPHPAHRSPPRPRPPPRARSASASTPCAITTSPVSATSQPPASRGRQNK